MQYYEELKQIGLQRLQDSMCQVVGLAALVTYPDGRPLTKTSKLCSFCALLNANPKSQVRGLTYNLCQGCRGCREIGSRHLPCRTGAPGSTPTGSGRNGSGTCGQQCSA